MSQARERTIIVISNFDVHFYSPGHGVSSGNLFLIILHFRVYLYGLKCMENVAPISINSLRDTHFWLPWTRTSLSIELIYTFKVRLRDPLSCPIWLQRRVHATSFYPQPIIIYRDGLKWWTCFAKQQPGRAKENFLHL